MSNLRIFENFVQRRFDFRQKWVPDFKGLMSFFAFSGVLFGRLQKSVYRTEKSLSVLILWTVQISKSQGVPFDLETLKLNTSKSLRLPGNSPFGLFLGLKHSIPQYLENNRFTFLI